MVWRLELAESGNKLGIGLRYVSSGTTALAMLCAIEIDDAGDTLKTIARKGFPRHEVAGDKEILMESLKILYNSGVKAKDVDDIIPKAASLAENYHAIKKALEGQADAHGEFEKWRWAVKRAW